MPKTVDELLVDFEKKHGMKIGTPDRVIPQPTGNLAIDHAIGIGGLPGGRITELYGLEASGKTTTALQTAVEQQRQIISQGTGDHVVFLDFEHALDTAYATSLGLDLDHPSLIVLQPNWLEQGAEAALELVDTGKVRLIIFDSVAAMAPKRLKEGSFDQATMAMHRAKLMSGLLQVMVSQLHELNCTAIFINHKMESVDMTGRPGLPPKVTTPGGRGLKFYASCRLEFNVGSGIKNKLDDVLTGEQSNQLVGNQVFVKCVKNKVGPPGRVVEVRSRYGKGFDNAWSAYQVLISRGLIVNSGSWFYFDESKVPSLIHQDMPVTTASTGRRAVQGEPGLLKFADEHPEWRDVLIALAVEALA